MKEILEQFYQQKNNPEIVLKINALLIDKKDFLQLQEQILKELNIPLKEWNIYRNQWTKLYNTTLEEIYKNQDFETPAEFIIKIKNPNIPDVSPKDLPSLKIPIPDEIKNIYTQLDFQIREEGLSPDLSFVLLPFILKSPIKSYINFWLKKGVKFLFTQQEKVIPEILRRTALTTIGRGIAESLPIPDPTIKQAIVRLSNYAGLYDKPFSIAAFEIIQQLKNISMATALKEKYDPLKFENISSTLIKRRKISPLLGSLLGIGEFASDLVVANALVEASKSVVWNKITDVFVKEAVNKNWNPQEVINFRRYLNYLGLTIRKRGDDWRFLIGLFKVKKSAQKWIFPKITQSDFSIIPINLTPPDVRISASKMSIKGLMPKDINNDDYIEYVSKIGLIEKDSVINFLSAHSFPLVFTRKKLQGKIFKIIDDIILIKDTIDTKELINILGLKLAQTLIPKGEINRLFRKFGPEMVRVYATFNNFTADAFKPTKKINIIAQNFSAYIVDPHTTSKIAPNFTKKIEEIFKTNKLDTIFNKETYKKLIDDYFKISIKKDFIRDIENTLHYLGHKKDSIARNLKRITADFLYAQQIAILNIYKNFTDVYLAVRDIEAKSNELFFELDDYLKLNIDLIKEYFKNPLLKKIVDKLTNSTMTNIELGKITNYYKNLDEALVFNEDLRKVNRKVLEKAFQIYSTLDRINRMKRPIVIPMLSKFFGKSEKQVESELPEFHINDSRRTSIRIFAEYLEGDDVIDTIYAGALDPKDAFSKVILYQNLGYSNAHIDIDDQAPLKFGYYLVKIHTTADKKIVVESFKHFNNKESLENYAKSKNITNYKIIEVRSIATEEINKRIQAGRYKSLPLSILIRIISKAGIKLSDATITNLLSSLGNKKLSFLYRKKRIPGLSYNFDAILERELDFFASLVDLNKKHQVRDLESAIKMNKNIPPDEYDLILKYLDLYNRTTPYLTHVLRNFTTIKFLGLKPRMIISEFWQRFNIEFPYLNLYFSPIKSLKFMSTSAVDYVKYITNKLKDIELKQFLDELVKEGRTQQFFDAIQIKDKIFKSLPPKSDERVIKILNDFFLSYLSFMESYLRTSAAITGYKVYNALIQKGIKPTLYGKVYTDRKEYAKAFADLVNFDYSRANFSIAEKQLQQSGIHGQILSTFWFFLRYPLTTFTTYAKVLVSSKEFLGLPKHEQLFLKKIFFYLSVVLLGGGASSLIIGGSARRYVQKEFFKSRMAKKDSVVFIEDLMRKYPYSALWKLFSYGGLSYITGLNFSYVLAPELDYRFKETNALGAVVNLYKQQIEYPLRFYKEGDYVRAIINFLAPVPVAQIYNSLSALEEAKKIGYIVTPIAKTPLPYKIEDFYNLPLIQQIGYVFGITPLEIVESYEKKDVVTWYLNELKKDLDKSYELLVAKMIKKVDLEHKKKFQSSDDAYHTQKMIEDLKDDIRKSAEKIIKEWGMLNIDTIIRKFTSRLIPYEFMPSEIRAKLFQKQDKNFIIDLFKNVGIDENYFKSDKEFQKILQEFLDEEKD